MLAKLSWFAQNGYKIKIKTEHCFSSLRALRENDLVEINKEGKWVYYSLNRKKLMELQQFIEKIILVKEKKFKSKC